jgi:hypothetical protein
MRLPRMTTRRWMIAIAVMAIGQYGAIVGWRLAVYRQRAALYGQLAKVSRGFARLPPDRVIPKGDGRFARTARTAAIWAHHYTALSRKYAQASVHPWLFLEPDPPPPDP